jgi:hypothetical protein
MTLVYLIARALFRCFRKPSSTTRQQKGTHHE